MTKARSISDLKHLEPNTRFEGTFLVQSKEVRSKRNGVRFLSLTLSDRTGSMDAKVWDNVEELVRTFHANDFVRAQGRVHVFHNRHQAIVTRLRTLPREQVDLRNLIPHTDHDIDEMYGKLLATVDGLSNPDLKRLMTSIFGDPEFADRYKRAPAAKTNHHARIGGLLEHSMSMLRAARLLATHYTDLDSELLACGVLLHDCGKVFELNAEQGFEYTDSGRLLGHVSMASTWVERKCDEIGNFPPRLKTVLLHLVLSHHGHVAFGSPRVPLFREALVLHLIDELDSKLAMMREAEKDIVPGSVWSPFHKGLERPVLDRNMYLQADTPQPPALRAPEEPRPPDPDPAPRTISEGRSEPAGPDTPMVEQSIRPKSTCTSKDAQPASDGAQPHVPKARPDRVHVKRPAASSSLPAAPRISQVAPAPSPPLPNQIQPERIVEDPAEHGTASTGVNADSVRT